MNDMTEISIFSPDGTVIQAGSGVGLTTAAGVWSFSTGKATTGNYILLNGKTLGSFAGVELRVANGGKLYSRDMTGQWYELSGAKWLAWVDPTLESTPSPDGTAVRAGSCGGLVTADGVWTFSTGKATTGNYILLNGQTVGNAVGVELDVANGGKLYSRDATGQWYEWSGTKWLAWVDPTLEFTPSPDGTAVRAGSCGGLVTADGVWTFSTGKATTGNYILLNGQTVGNAVGVELDVANGGKLYSRDATGQWYELSGAKWLAWVDPTLESTPSPDGTAVRAGSCGGLVTADGVWTFSTGKATTGNYILLNGQTVGNGVGVELDVANGGKLYSRNLQGQWSQWTGAKWSAIADPNLATTSTQSTDPGGTGTATPSVTLDTTPPAVSVALVSDTGSLASDGITSDPAVKGIGEANTLVTIKEGGVTLGTTMAESTGAWNFTPAGLVDGVHTLSASQTDLAGNTGTATLSFTLDGAAPAMSMALVSDTGGSASDGITSNSAVEGVGQANTLVTITEGGVTLGTAMADGTGAWSFTPVGRADGAHVFSASQTDLAGNTGTATLSFTLDATAPAMSMALVSDTGGSASDGITSNSAVEGVGQANTLVTITEGGVTLGTAMADGTGAWNFMPASLVDGVHTLTASQIDLAGNTGAATLSFTLDATAPAVSMALVADTGSSSTDKITSNPAVKGVGQANSLITIKEGGVTLGTVMADGTGAWNFTPAGLVDGVHTLSASQTDLAGNTGSATLGFTLDRAAPVLFVNLIADTGISATDKVTANPGITGKGDANVLVTIKEGIKLLGTTMADATGAWSFTPIGLPEGTHTYGITQTDLAGNTGSTTKTFTLDSSQSSPPLGSVLSIDLVSDTGISATDKITSNSGIKGTGQANTLVTIKEGGVTLGTTTADGSGAWSFTPAGLANGAHTLTATQTDLAGNTTTATQSFTLDKAAPLMSMTLVSDTGASATDKITSNPTIKGTADANTFVTIKEGGTTLGTVTATSTGNWSFTPTALTDGPHTFSATQTDLAGNTGTATLSFTLDKTAPVVSMTLLSDTGSSATDKITSNPAVNGLGQANTLVTIKEGGATLGTTIADGTGAWSFTPTGIGRRRTHTQRDPDRSRRQYRDGHAELHARYATAATVAGRRHCRLASAKHRRDSRAKRLCDVRPGLQTGRDNARREPRHAHRRGRLRGADGRQGDQQRRLGAPCGSDLERARKSPRAAASR